MWHSVEKSAWRDILGKKTIEDSSSTCEPSFREHDLLSDIWTIWIGDSPLGAGLEVEGFGVMATVYSSTSGHWHRPNTVRQKSVEVRVPTTIARRASAIMGPSKPMAPSLLLVSNRGRKEVWSCGIGVDCLGFRWFSIGAMLSKWSLWDSFQETFCKVR